MSLWLTRYHFLFFYFDFSSIRIPVPESWGTSNFPFCLLFFLFVSYLPTCLINSDQLNSLGLSILILILILLSNILQETALPSAKNNWLLLDWIRKHPLICNCPLLYQITWGCQWEERTTARSEVVQLIQLAYQVHRSQSAIVIASS